MYNPIRNNLIIELHVPDLDLIKGFYSKLGFKITMEDKLNEKNLGY
jgi:predicted lactoylglutathione lyase